MIFKIGQTEIHKRRKNMLLGVLFSLGLSVTMVQGNAQDSLRYNDFLIGSIVLFFIFANVINLIRHFKWKGVIKNHQVEVLEDQMVFYKADEKTVLKIDQIQKVFLKRQKGLVTRMILELPIGNKIRLEGYEEMDAFAQVIVGKVDQERIVE